LQVGRGVIIKFFGPRKEWGEKPREEIYSLDLAYRDPKVPWGTKLFIACVVGYGFSSIDLIPDLGPIIGDLDDPIWVPIKITLALKMIPPLYSPSATTKTEQISVSGKQPTRLLCLPSYVFGSICIIGHLPPNKGY